MVIRESTDSDLGAVLDVETRAFGDEKGPEIADLVNDLWSDPSALPLLSLLAFADDRAIGHVLFTTVRIDGPEKSPSASILAPLAVVPDAQRQGVGGRLIEEGLKRLVKSGVALVFVLGHPEYYPRHGFKPAGSLGFEAPYPILEEHAGAWMVQELSPGILGRVSGRVVCADMLSKPQHWRE